MALDGIVQQHLTAAEGYANQVYADIANLTLMEDALTLAGERAKQVGQNISQQVKAIRQPPYRAATKIVIGETDASAEVGDYGNMYRHSNLARSHDRMAGDDNSARIEEIEQKGVARAIIYAFADAEILEENAEVEGVKYYLGIVKALFEKVTRPDIFAKELEAAGMLAEPGGVQTTNHHRLEPTKNYAEMFKQYLSGRDRTIRMGVYANANKVVYKRFEAQVMIGDARHMMPTSELLMQYVKISMELAKKAGETVGENIPGLGISEEELERKVEQLIRIGFARAVPGAYAKADMRAKKVERDDTRPMYRALSDVIRYSRMGRVPVDSERIDGIRDIGHAAAAQYVLDVAESSARLNQISVRDKGIERAEQCVKLIKGERTKRKIEDRIKTIRAIRPARPR